MPAPERSFSRFRRHLTVRSSGSGRWPNRLVLRRVDSTNSFGRRVVAAYGREGEPPPPLVCVAWEQFRGRGRGDHRWTSPAGQGAYVSLLVPGVSAEHLPSLPLLAAVAVARALQPRVPRPVRLRWPNDVLVGSRKLGGILLESSTSATAAATHVVIGVGVNLAATASDLPSAEATSLVLEGEVGSDLDAELAGLVEDLVAAVDAELEHVGDEKRIAERYAAASAHRQGDVLCCRTPEGMVRGKFRGFSPGGFLRLETAEGERTMAAGELLRASSPDRESEEWR